MLRFSGLHSFCKVSGSESFFACFSASSLAFMSLCEMRITLRNALENALYSGVLGLDFTRDPQECVSRK